MAVNKFTSMKNGALWIQPNGPGTAVYFLGCHDLDGIKEAQGDVEYLRAFRPDGSGWDVVGSKISPPDPVSASIETLIGKQRDYLETVKCRFALYALQRECGRADVFENYVRGQILANVRRVGRDYGSFVTREEDSEMTLSVDLEAEPPLLDVDLVKVDRIGVTETVALNDVWANSDTRCIGDCGAALSEGDLGVAAADAGAGVTANADFTSNNGLTWTAGAADPFLADKHIMAVVKFALNTTVTRTLVVENAPAGAQGHVAYSDNNGVSWTVVNLGGAAAGHGCAMGGALFALDRYHIWLASAAGYIYFSSDGGASWTAQEAGVIHAGVYNHVHFADAMNGIAVGAAGIVAKTSDGGTVWQAATAVTGAPILNCCWMLDPYRLWVGTATGLLFRSVDAGVTWLPVTSFTGTGVGQVRDIAFLNPYQGMMISNTAGPVGTVHVTINGGYTWNALTTPTNSGLNRIALVSPTKAFVVGEATGGTAVVLRVSAA